MYGDYMKVFFTITKKGLAVFVALLIVVFLMTFKTLSLKYTAIDGSTQEKRDFFIKNLDYVYDGKGITKKEIVIPTDFSSVYENYNKLQKEAGFDLEKYKGENAVVYSYPSTDGNKILHIIIYKGKIIGGDIAETAFDGEMLPLKN